jgi:hypothetical protein
VTLGELKAGDRFRFDPSEFIRCSHIRTVVDLSNRYVGASITTRLTPCHCTARTNYFRSRRVILDSFHDAMQRIEDE